MLTQQQQRKQQKKTQEKTVNKKATMVINKNYNSSDEEEWDMVPDEIEAGAAESETAAEEAPTSTTATTTTVEADQNEVAASTPNSTSAEVANENPSSSPPPAFTAPATNPPPSAPLEQETKEDADVLGLAEQQAKLGITNETSPEEIERLIMEVASVTNETPPPAEATKEDTPLLTNGQATRTTTESKDASDKEAPAEETSTSEQAQPNTTTANKPKLVPNWLRASLGAATQILKDVEQKHDIKQRTRQSLNTVGTSLRNVGSTIHKETEGIRTKVATESHRFSQTVQQKAEEIDVKGKAEAAADTISHSAKTAGDTIGKGAKTAGDTIAKGAQSAGDTIAKGAHKAGDAIGRGANKAGAKAKELNKDGKLTDLVAAATVIGAGILLAKGNSGAGAAVLATGGAAYMATESTNGRRYDQGLNENLHMD